MTRLPLAGLALALLCGGATAAPLPDEAFLSAFAVACLDGYDDTDARDAAIAAAGWRPVADDANPVLAEMLAMARASLRQAEDEEGYTGTAAVYGRDGGAGGPYLVTTILEMPDDGEGPLGVLGCYLYDFEATQPLDAEPITRRFGEEPAAIDNQPGIIVSEAWDIESLDGVWELRSTFIPVGSPGVDVTGFAGRVLILTSLRGEGP
jgi:hypothetical protein